MTSIKLPLLVCLSVAGAACAPLGQYGAFAQPAPGAAAPAAATPEAAPAAAPIGSDPSDATAASQPSGPTTVSVSIRNSCGKNVKVFYGDKPKFGSGTYSSSSSNSVSSHTFRPGEQFWIVDDSQNGIANVQIGDTTREIQIVGSCDQLAAR
jgi:hypothetical protein